MFVNRTLSTTRVSAHVMHNNYFMVALDRFVEYFETKKWRRRDETFGWFEVVASKTNTRKPFLTGRTDRVNRHDRKRLGNAYERDDNRAFPGSLSCVLCELTSHRAVTFWGGLLASAGMMCSSFAGSTHFLYIR